MSIYPENTKSSVKYKEKEIIEFKQETLAVDSLLFVGSGKARRVKHKLR